MHRRATLAYAWIKQSGKSSPTFSAKPLGLGAACQPWIAKGEQSGLLTHIAATESVSLVASRRLKTSQECNVTQTTGHRTKSDKMNAIKKSGEIKYDRRRCLGAAALTFAATQLGIISSARAQSRKTSATRAISLDMIAELADDNKMLAGRLREAHNVCEEHRDVATASLIEVWIDKTERGTWFLSEIERGTHQ